MSDDRNPLEVLLDLMIFGPIGFAAEAHRLAPELAAKGRETVDSQVRLARMVGQFAAKARAPNHRRLRPASPPPPGTDRPSSAPTVATNGEVETDPVDEVIPVRIEASTARVAAVRADLAIADYDSLAASQVLPLLDNLSPSELEAVQAHESEHRKRKTILGRIAQIRSR